MESNANDNAETDTSFKGQLEPELTPQALAGQSEDYQYNQRNAIIFLIDFRKGMFEENADGSYWFKKCIECYRTIMLNIARKQHKYIATGIIIFGTSKSSDKAVPQNVVELQPLDIVSVERIVQLDNMLMNNFEDLKETYGQADSFSLTLALNYSQITIKKWKSNIYRKGIIIFTNDDNPYKSNIMEGHKARKQAEALSLIGVDLNLVPFGNFDVDKFYKELVLIAKDVSIDEWSQQEGSSSTDEIIQNIEDIIAQYHSHYRILKLGKERSILVSMYRIYSEPKRVSQHKREYINPEETEVIEDESGEQEKNIEFTSVIAKPTKHYDVGRKLIEIEKDHLRLFQIDVGFTLIGFVDTNNVPEHYSVKNPYFMLPYEKDPRGAELWNYILSRCTARHLSMICWFKYHKSASLSHVALTPITMKSSTDHPIEGMVVKILPFLDNIIDLEENEPVMKYEASEAQKSAAERLVKKLSFSYNPGMFHDHEHRSAIAMIEAIALKTKQREMFEDDTLVDESQADDMLGDDLIRDFTECSLSDREEDGQEPELKKAKVMKPAKEPRSTHEIIQLIKQRKAENLTAKELKDFLKEEGVKCVSNMTKPILIQAAYQKFCKD